MPQTILGSRTAAQGVDTAADLDPMFLELFDLRDKIKTSGYSVASYAFTIDSSLRTLFGFDSSVSFAGTNCAVQNHGLTIPSSSYGQSIWAAGSSSGNRVALAKSRSGVIGSHTSGLVQSGDSLGQIDGMGSDGTDFQVAARITLAVDTAAGTGDMPGRISLATTADGATTPTERLRIDSNGHGSPGADNAYSWGIAARRFSVVYAATGTINTSDAREKTAVLPLTSAEVSAACALAREIGTFRFLNAVAKKGGDARQHIGMTVQRAMEIMTDNGLDPLKYGFICFDAWPEQLVTHEEVTKPHPKLVDSAGEPVLVTIEPARTETLPAGDRFSFRTDELLLFLARGFEARLSALEARD